MKNILTLCITIIAFSFPMSLKAAGPCPIQGLDKKVCPIVVNFFDEMAKHDSEFAKHWQNHQWIQQAGDNYVPSFNVKEHTQLTFREDRNREDINTFISNVLNSASKNDPKFNSILNSHNYFAMTVQAMHLYLQRGADHFNKAGTFHYNPDGDIMEADLVLEYRYNVQVKENNPYLNKLGIYSTTQSRYASSTYIDTTSYQAGLKVNPIVITPSSPITSIPKTPKVVIKGQQKTISGANTPSVIPPTVNKNNAGNYTSINKKPGNKNRQTSQGNKIPQPKPLAPVLAPNKVPQATPHIVVSPPKIQQQIPKPMQVPPMPVNKVPQPKPLVPTLAPNKVPQASPNLIPQKQAYNVPTPMKSVGKNSLVNHKKAHAPVNIVFQQASKGTNKNNINKRLVTNLPGSQIENNTRHYVLDDDSNIWSCKVSGLGYRVTKDSNGKVQSFGHVETNHIKSPQLAHIPASHTSGNKCLISVHK